MNTCLYCGEPLPTSLDEFGNVDAPVCQSCFFTGAGAQDDSNELTRLEAAVEEAREEMHDQAQTVHALECRLEESVYDPNYTFDAEDKKLLEADRRWLAELTAGYETAVGELLRAQWQRKKIIDAEKRKLQAWVGA